MYNDATQLHLETNPLSDAIKEKYQSEIDRLKHQLQQAEQQPTESSHLLTNPNARTSSPSSNFDAQKLHKRLKERFREQIALFREGVYLLTGCKVDMSFSDSDRPHFKVRSMYSEREEDHLMFTLTKESQSLNLMSTDLARVLMEGPCAVYMKRFESVPAFMASVTLALFEKQTMI